jgi:uncharacterized membrane protein YgdD (TMEM256/DUF423 family)
MKGKMIAGTAALLLGLAVVLGAWNAHGMESLVEKGLMQAKYIKTFHTGVQYQFLIATVLLIIGIAYQEIQKLLLLSTVLLLSGMFVFSGSLYLLAFYEMLGEGLKILGMVAPIGGLCMTAGFLLLGIHFFKNKQA